MRVLLILIMLINSLLIKAQTLLPIPPEGIDTFREYVNRNIIIHEKLRDKDLKGIVELEFRVNNAGEIDSLDIVKDIDATFGLEIAKIIKSAGPWTPAYMDGTPIAQWVNISFEIPVKINPIDRLAQPNISIESFYEKFLLNFRYPEQAINAGIQGEFTLTFGVRRDGSVTNIKLLENPGYNIEEAAIRALKRCGKWIPAVINNETQYSETSFTFTLNLKKFRRHIM